MREFPPCILATFKLTTTFCSRADELNFTLCMFVKEVKKPNGDPYAPDSIFYLTLGIQEYLFENSRIDNIFTDQYYETFTSALHEVVNDFKLPVNELGYFVTRSVELKSRAPNLIKFRFGILPRFRFERNPCLQNTSPKSHQSSLMVL